VYCREQGVPAGVEEDFLDPGVVEAHYLREHPTARRHGLRLLVTPGHVPARCQKLQARAQGLAVSEKTVRARLRMFVFDSRVS